MALILGISLHSCDNEFSVNDQREEVTVVYGLLDAAVDTNWVRIERGYLGMAPAEQSFDIPDSLYIPDSLLTAQLIGESPTGTLTNPIPLRMDQGSKQLEPGLFTTDDYRIYYTDRKLAEDYIYHLEIKRLDNGDELIRASTEMVGINREENGRPAGFRMKNPVQGQTPPRFLGPITFFESKNAAIYEVDIYFYYKEYDIATKQSVNKTLKIDYETITGSTGQGEVSTRKKYLSNLYEAIANRLEPTNEKLRFFRWMKIDVWAGGEQLAKYIELNRPSGGIAQSKPEFPQIENGAGLLSSRTLLEVDNVSLEGNELLSYYLNPILCDLNFAGFNQGDTCVCRLNDAGETEPKCPY